MLVPLTRIDEGIPEEPSHHLQGADLRLIHDEKTQGWIKDRSARFTLRHLGSPPVPGTPLHPTLEGFLEGLRELGYIDGKTVLIDIRNAEGKFERLPDLAADLVRLKVDVIVTGAGPASLKAAREATSSIPIVMAAASADPVRSGIIASLASELCQNCVRIVQQLSATIGRESLNCVLLDLYPSRPRERRTGDRP